MSQKPISFLKAKPLKGMHGKQLLEPYNYNLANKYDKSWLSKIANDFHITKIEKINNPLLYGMYLLSKEELSTRVGSSKKVQEFIMYHSTSTENAKNIAYNNIDWRKTKRSKYGKGACFSSEPTYAYDHASSSGAFVVFRVLVKNIENIPGIRYSLRVPTKTTYDTTLGNNGFVYVKYDDFQFYPEYIVYNYCTEDNSDDYDDSDDYDNSDDYDDSDDYDNYDDYDDYDNYDNYDYDYNHNYNYDYHAY